MNLDKIEHEREALKTIRGRWQLRGWKFTPLERVDGVNETLESIDALRNSPVRWSSVALEYSVDELLDSLEESYRYALEPWAELRTVFDCEASQCEFLRWPDGMFPAKIQSDARSRFWELVSTSRFSVSAVPNLRDLQRVNWTSQKVTIRHVVSLAVIVCIKKAIEDLETIDGWWREDSQPYRAGKPFDWLSDNDPEQLDRILSVMLEAPDELEPHNQKIRDALSERDQANAWLSQLNTLNFAQAEVKQSNKISAAKKSEKARRAAKNLRKGIDLTPEVTAVYFNERPGQKFEIVCGELAAKYGISERTVSRRYSLAKGKNLLP